MLPDFLWIFFVCLFAAYLIWMDKRKHRSEFRHYEKSEKEKEVERAVEKEKARRGGPPMSGGGH